ncbi:hypothetical protein Tco_0540894 [Tanacetum coccineum]
MDDDLFTYEVKIANILCDSKMDNESEQEADDDIGYDLSDVAFIEWLRSKIFNYKTMDHYTMKALWIYWIRGDDEVELTDEESSDNDDEIAKGLRPMKITKMRIYEWNKDVPWVDEKPWTDAGDYEWYEALEDCKLKDEALRNKAIMEGSIKEDDDESLHEQSVCKIRRYMMIKYSFNDDEEYVAVKEDEYDDLTVTRKEACRAYQEIFQIMDEGWMVTRAE